MKIKIKRLFKRVKKVICRPDMLLLPGQLSFFLFMAIIPTITLVSYGASILNLSMDFLENFLEKAFSSEISGILLSTSQSGGAGIQFIIIIIISYYIASNGMASLIVASNTIYGIKNGGWFKRRIKAIFMSVILVIITTFLLIVPIFGNQIMDLIFMVNLNSEVTNAIYQVFIYLRSPILWIVLFFLIKLIYVMAPDRKVKMHNANYGAMFTTVSWIVWTYGYSYYINNFADYSALYGGLASVCILLMWIYFLVYFFVIGMALNFQKENEDLEKTVPINIKEIQGK